MTVAPDLPVIAQPEKMTESKGRWMAAPNAEASVIFEAVPIAMKSAYLLRSQPSVDPP